MTTPPMFLATKDMSGEWRAFMGMQPADQGALLDYATLSQFGRAAADEAWVYACINRLVRDAMGVPLVVYVRKGKAKEPAEESSDTRAQDIQYLLDNVNDTSMTGTMFKGYHIAAEAMWGEDYWLKVRGRLGGPPQELHWLRAPDVEPQRPAGAPWITAYRYTPSDQPGVGYTDYQPKQIVAHRTINLQDPTRGLSAMSALRYELSVNRQAAMHTAYTLANWGIPAGAWVAPKGAEISAQDQSAIRRALRALRGPRSAGKTPVLPEGLDWKPLGMNPKDAEWLSARKVSRMTIAAAFGIPLVLVGDDEKNTVYANLRDAERVYWRGTMIPKLDAFADTLNNWLLPDFGADARKKYLIAFDYEQIEALRPPIDVEMAAWDGAMDREAIVPNEFRRHFNIGPDVPWGDDPLRSTKLIQEPPDELPAGAPQVEVGNVAVIPTSGNEDPIAAGPAGGSAAPHEASNPSTSFGAKPPMARSIYAVPEVRAWLADTSLPIDAAAKALGLPPSEALAVGLRRRYSAAQLLEGVPAEGYAGIGETDA